MLARSQIGSILLGGLTTLVAGGCVGNDTAPRPADVGDTANSGGTSTAITTTTGGAKANGGSPSTGGLSATGGRIGTGANGGTLNTGGTLNSGGALNTGGTTASGGTTSVATTGSAGGSANTGGLASTGGKTDGGGFSATGGALTVGGTASGGFSTTGGAVSSGGIASGGKSATTATGGFAAGGNAGTATTGGTATVGGTSSSGGTSQTCSGSLGIPQSTSATNGTDDAKIVLRWDAVSCAQTYEVYRATSETGNYTSIGSTGLTVFEDTNNQDTVAYYYGLRSYSETQGYSDYSAVVQGSRKQGYVLTTSFGSSGTGDGQFSSAYGIAVDGSSNVYVLDTYNHRVEKFDSSGTFITKWGGITLSPANGKFYYPYAIGVLGSYLTVGDNRGAVQRFALDGTYVDRFDITGPFVKDLDFDASGGLYLADDYWAASPANLTIDKYNASRVYQNSFGSSGEENGQFAGGIHLAVDSLHSLVYVSDNGHSKIQVFTLGGSYVSAWGASGTGAMQFNGPAGIAVDSAGDVYVADQGNNRISKFGVTNGTATLAATWSSPQCQAIDVDASGQVFVLATSKVMVYRRR